MLFRVGLGLLGVAAVAGGLVVACSSDSTAAPTAPDGSAPDGALNVAPNDSGGTATGSVDAGEDAAQGPSPDAGALTLGAPLAGGAPGTWTWVPFPNSSCANGTATGIGVSFGTTKRLVVYLEGGGACWNALTCYQAKTAANLDGYDEAKFQSNMGEQSGSELDRTLADNPFKDDNFVYVPYCTGDVHAGSTVQAYAGAPNGETTAHVGRKNLDAFLERIVPTFADASRVVLTGSSAGGFGAALNYERVRQAFGGSLRVDLIDDSGPPFPTSDITSYSDWSVAWNLPAALPTGCAACATDLTKVIPYYATTYADARFALLSYSQDETIRTFFGLLGPPVAANTFETELDSVITTQFDPTTNAKVFEVAGQTHTMLGQFDTTTTNGKTLSSWVTDMEADSAAWATEKVAPSGQ